ncbi:hypothetical protein XF_1040 [Xylella fastidiosa 9a5c]|uniref:Uncharacterized protein n=1 Tax=Xylella fastidiosa (strain 9a5c) TaxID=160492 RepID=Q9PEI8_XYLFA|nr:hypothetical protein XF_1040 [Xylella fastidiosa 9a5c]
MAFTGCAVGCVGTFFNGCVAGVQLGRGLMVCVIEWSVLGRSGFYHSVSSGVWS